MSHGGAYPSPCQNQPYRQRRGQATHPPCIDLLTLVKQRNLNWYGHIIRCSGVAKTFLQGTVRVDKEKIGKEKDKRTSVNGQAWKFRGPSSEIRSAPAKIWQKWKVDKTVNQAKEGLKMKEVIGLSQTGRKDLDQSLRVRPKARALLFTLEGGTKSWCRSAAGMDTRRKSLLDGCDDRKFSADLPEWNKHHKVIQDTGMSPDIVFHSSATGKIIMVELTVPYESTIEEAKNYKRENLQRLEQGAGKPSHRLKRLALGDLLEHQPKTF
ncbi:reverse transcriptase [Plakobranchus ocellatus]|uniref:Reverse transcriptase n=1 Tax=Plakobranchus ocellatus TaxID=259542 RepID=A0AAV4DYW4_9GAST|nr:reverse transcriptase [Plakobranchus ocellatus]